MGTKLQLDKYLPMRDPSRDSNGGSWPGYYGENNLPSNGHYSCGFSPTVVGESFPVYDREVLKQTMLDQEAIFKNQVYELHRLYRVQRELMDEVKGKEQYKQRIPYEASSSSTPLPPQMQSDAPNWNASSFPLANHVSVGQSAIRSNGIQSYTNAVKAESSIQAGPILLQSCSSPKGSEVSDFRPTKHRRKMLDLQLPADEYIDTDEVEQCRDGKASGLANDQLADRNCGSIAPKSGEKLFPNHPERVVCNGGASGSSSKKSFALADLNEPVQVDETTGAKSLDVLSSATHHEFQHQGPSSSKFLGLHTDAVQNPKHGNLNWTSNNSHFDSKESGPGWFPYAIDADRNKDNMRSINLGVQPEKTPAPSQSVQLLLDQAHQPAAFLSNDHIKVDPWRPKIGSGLETSDRSFHRSHVPSPLSFIHSSDMGNSWEHSVSSWGKQGSCLTQRSPSVHANPFMPSASFSRSSQSSNTPNNEIAGNMWHPNGNANARPNSGFGIELPLRNGFYHGCSSSGFKEPPLRFPSVGCDVVRSNNDKSDPGSSKFTKTLTGIDANPIKDLNLNVAQIPPNGFSNDWATQQGVKIIDRKQKQDDPLAALPWLRPKDASINESLSSKKGSNSFDSSMFQDPVEVGKVLDRQYSVASISCNGDVNVNRQEINVGSTAKKIMGVSMYEKPSWLTNEAPSVVNFPSGPHLSRDEEIQSRGKRRVLDINAPCDPIDLELSDSAVEDSIVVVQKKTESKTPSIRNHFDLNSCFIEDEEVPLRTSLANGSAISKIKFGTGIDLEAPVVIENEDSYSLIEGSACVQQYKMSSELIKEIPKGVEFDLAISAAEVIVAISSIIQQNPPPIEDIIPIQIEAPSGDPLSWFVDVACSSPGDFGRQLEAELRDKNGVEDNDDCLSSGLDYLESMTLKLTECTAEEYMPKPSIPEFPKTEDTRTSSVGTRPRRGQARRGRQRRDFQRDILPGLASLSRHEVTEDLQTFGGLMKATGHAWQSGARRNATRNGCGRGRKRASAAAAAASIQAQTPERTTCAPSKQQLNAEVALEWGKTTRRPRRQRCAAGNPAPVTLT